MLNSRWLTPKLSSGMLMPSAAERQYPFGLATPPSQARAPLNAVGEGSAVRGERIVRLGIADEYEVRARAQSPSMTAPRE